MVPVPPALSGIFRYWPGLSGSGTFSDPITTAKAAGSAAIDCLLLPVLVQLTIPILPIPFHRLIFSQSAVQIPAMIASGSNIGGPIIKTPRPPPENLTKHCNSKPH